MNRAMSCIEGDHGLKPALRTWRSPRKWRDRQLASGVRGDVHFETDGRIVIKNPAAAFAEHQALGVTKILDELRPKHDLAAGTAAVSDFRHRRPAVPFLADP